MGWIAEDNAPVPAVPVRPRPKRPKRWVRIGDTRREPAGDKEEDEDP